MTSAVAHLLALLFQSIEPVIETVSSPSVLGVRISCKSERCWFTSAFVGAIITARPPCWCNRSEITIHSTAVFPRPVGRTRSVGAPRQSPAASIWYALASTDCALSRGCSMYAVIDNHPGGHGSKGFSHFHIHSNP